MNKKYLAALIAVGLIFSFGAVTYAEQPQRQFTVLVVDETKTMEISMRIQGLVGALKQRPEIKVITRVVSPDHPTANPIKEPKDLRVDAALIFPQTIETSTVNQVWIATRPYTEIPLEERARTANMMNQLKNGIEKAFSGNVNAVGVDDDVIPAYFSTLFLREGVLR